MKSLSPQTVYDAMVMLRQGKSHRKISKSLGISVASVSKIRQQDKKNIPAPKMGRSCKVTKKTKEILTRQFNTGKVLTLRQGQQLVQSSEGKHVHVESVRNYLKQQGLRAYIRPKKPDLTADHIAARYKFAKEHLNWTVDDWKTVMFSDETLISKMGSFGRKFHYRKPENKTLQMY